MQANEIGVPLFEMTFDRKIVEQKYRGREETLNEHLVKLLAFHVDERTRTVWQKEVRNHLLYLSGLRMRNKRPPTQRDIFDWLYQDPFGGNETTYVNVFVMMHEDDYQRNDQTAESITERIRQFFVQVAAVLAKGDPTTIPQLVNAL